LISFSLAFSLHFLSFPSPVDVCHADKFKGKFILGRVVVSVNDLPFEEEIIVTYQLQTVRKEKQKKVTLPSKMLVVDYLLQ
jgi:hypothetical protein